MNHKYLLLGVFLFLAFAKTTYAYTGQDNNKQLTRVSDSVKPKQERLLIDGVSGVVGDYLILKSDIFKAQEEIKRQSRGVNISRCDLIKSLLREKMFAHHAIQDSIVVSDDEINGRVDQTLAYLRNEANGNEQILLEIYNMNSIEEIKAELYKINRDQILANRMQQRLTEEVQITPEEVRDFFYSLPEDQRPLFNTEVELAQIVIKPKASEEAVQEVVEQLKEFRKDVLENGASFAGKAALHSDDSATEQQGGVISLKRNDPFVKPFKDAAFSLQEGEVSEPFETQFGWHILYVDKIRGQVRDVRHILLTPFISTEQVRLAKAKLNELREKFLYEDADFGKLARENSDEEETAKNGGKLINPSTGEARFELTRLPEEYSVQVQFLEKGDVSGVLSQRDKAGREYYKIILVQNKIEDHKADYALDYLKIKDIALNNKRLEVIDKWQTNKIKDTYIKIGADLGDCESLLNWKK